MLTDRQLLREQAILGLQNAWYLGSEIIGLSKDELPRPENEVKPIYDWFSQERPPWLRPRQKWLRFWSSPRFTAKSYIAMVKCTQRIIINPNEDSKMVPFKLFMSFYPVSSEQLFIKK